MMPKIRANQIRRGVAARRTSSPSGFRLSSGCQASYYDPKTKQFTLIDTCYSTHHLQSTTTPTRPVLQRAGRSDLADRHEGTTDEGRAESRRLVRPGKSTRTATEITKPWNTRAAATRSCTRATRLPARSAERRRGAVRSGARHDGQLQILVIGVRSTTPCGAERADPASRAAAARQQSAVDLQDADLRVPSLVSIRAA
jgi:hypothetical protein